MAEALELQPPPACKDGEHELEGPFMGARYVCRRCAQHFYGPYLRRTETEGG